MTADTPAWNGVPENPEHSGFYWITVREDGTHSLALWTPHRQSWWLWWMKQGQQYTAAEIAISHSAVTPLLTPSEVAAREQAAAVAMRDAANQAIATLHEYEDSRALNAASDAVDTLPIETGALDAMLAQARQEGAKAEREACARISEENESNGPCVGQVVASIIHARRDA